MDDAIFSSSSTTSEYSIIGENVVSRPILASSNPKKRAGRKKFKETRHPVFRGVRQRNNNKWVCELREPNKKTRIWLGTFPTLEMAARAHDVAALALRGTQACLNFADSAWRLPVPVSRDAKEIRRAAVEAAEMFRQTQQDTDVSSSSGSCEEEDDDEDDEVMISSSYSMRGQQNMTMFDFEINRIQEDDEFGMREMIADMAQGLMVAPPPYWVAGYNNDDELLLDCGNSDISLWSYSL